MPRIQWDFTISIQMVGAFVIFVLAGIGAWYNLKEEVAINKQLEQTHYVEFRTYTSGLEEVLKGMREEQKTTNRLLNEYLLGQIKEKRPR